MAIMVQNGPNRISEADLKVLEKRLALDLPAEYRDFLVKHNGGEPEPRWFAYPKVSDDYDRGGFDRISFFYSAIVPSPTEPTMRDLESAVQHFRSELELPRKYLPIGQTQEDIVVLGCKGQERDNVFYWSDIDAGFDTSFFVAVADSFGQFLNGLGYPASAPWMELIDNGDADGIRRWLATGGNAKETDEQTGFSPWEYADFACQLELFELLSL